MNHTFMIIIVTALPSAALIYLAGVLLTKKLRLATAAKWLGFPVVWLLTIFIAIVLAEGGTPREIEEHFILAAFIATTLVLIGLDIAGKKAPDEAPDREGGT